MPERFLNRRTVIELSLFLITIVWALNFSVIKSSLDEIDPLSFNGLRFVCAAAIIWAVLRWRGETIRIPKKDWWPLIGMGILANLVYQGLFIVGIDYTYSANVAVMMGTIPIWVALISHLFSDEKMNLVKTIGVVLAFGGVVFIILGGSNELDFGSNTFTGDMLIVAAAIVWGAYTVMARSFLKRYTALQFSAVTTTIGCLLLFFIGLPSMTRIDWSGVSAGAFGAVLYSGLLSIGLAYIVWNYAVQEIGAVRSAAYQNLVPVLGLAFGVLLLNEQLTLMQYGGSGFVIAGIMLARWKRRGKAQNSNVQHAKREGKSKKREGGEWI